MEQKLFLFANRLDKVLKGIAICPLLGEGGTMAYGGKMTQTETVLHALVPASFILLPRLANKAK